MAVTSVMEHVDYEHRNFLCDPNVSRHPLWLSDKHFIYHLQRDEEGSLMCTRDNHGNPIVSARKLSEICVFSLVHHINVLKKMSCDYLPSNIYPLMLTEAMYNREANAIEWLVSTWPMKVLRIYDVIPTEDYVENDYLTTTLEGSEANCLVDSIISGLLKLRPESRLKLVDFSGFPKDRKLCRELCRLPILWMKPKKRTVDDLHEIMSESIEVTKDKVQRFLNRISVVYHNIDGNYNHGNKIEPIIILLDLHISIDDVPLGLSLHKTSAFKFAANKVWMKHIPEVILSTNQLYNVLDTKRITHFEYEEPLLPRNEQKLQNMVDAFGDLENLIALSLPNSLDRETNPGMISQLNGSLQKLKKLQKLNFSYCNINGQLENLLDGLKQKVIYLNLKDCRLNEEDLFFLIHWRPLSTLRELNLSCNNLMLLDQVVIALLERMKYITCLSLSFCSLSIHSQVMIARECKESSRLKVLAMQNYVPLPENDTMEMLHICAMISTLQKVILFPEVYAFPGLNEEERRSSKIQMLATSYTYLERRGRPDIEVE